MSAGGSLQEDSFAMVSRETHRRWGMRAIRMLTNRVVLVGIAQLFALGGCKVLM